MYMHLITGQLEIPSTSLASETAAEWSDLHRVHYRNISLQLQTYKVNRQLEILASSYKNVSLEINAYIHA